MYGITETTVHVTYCPLSADDILTAVAQPDWRSRFRISRIYILDRYGEPVPVGVAGELYVGGAGVARGYLNRPELTAERFVPDPFGPSPERGCTGPAIWRASWRTARSSIWGAIDQQVKIRGFRIELGEIEAALAQHAGRARGGGGGARRGRRDTQLVAYVVPEAGAAAACAMACGRLLRSACRTTWCRRGFVRLEALPLTPNGKVDRKALPGAPMDSAEERGYVAPRTETEAAVAEIWAEVLKSTGLASHDNFFALGGHSLLAIAGAVARCARLSSGAAAAGAVRGADGGGDCRRGSKQAQREAAAVQVPAIVPVARDGALPLSFAQQRLWFLDQLEPESRAYNIPAGVRLAGRLDVEALRRTLNEVVRRHEALRTHLCRRRWRAGAGDHAGRMAPCRAGSSGLRG